MLKLHGFTRSNYYNVAKMALLEKGVDFEEVNVFPSQEEDFLGKSPMGKIPCLETPNGFLTETEAILQYVDEAFEGPSLFPGDAWQRAQARELMHQVELYVDLAVRPTFAEAFFGGEVSDEVKRAAEANLKKGLAAIARRARFSPYIAGEQFTAADAMAFYCLPLAGMVCGKFFDFDPVAHLEGAAGMMAAVAERPSAQAIAASMEG
ncbi:MAG: glutathione S-transferase family protein [Acidobacteriota bacterium]